jgi:hypothetical protein
VRRSDHGDQTSADYLLCAAQEALLFKGNPSITTAMGAWPLVRLHCRMC